MPLMSIIWPSVSVCVSDSDSDSVCVCDSVCCDSEFFLPPNLNTPATESARYMITITMITAVTIPMIVIALSIFGFKSLPSSSSSSSSSSASSSKSDSSYSSSSSSPSAYSSSLSASVSSSFKSSATPLPSFILSSSSGLITLVLPPSTSGAIVTKSSSGCARERLMSVRSSSIVWYLRSGVFCVHFKMIFSKLIGRSGA